MNSTESRRRKVGLALSGGAARGLAHVGVLRVLQKEGIPIDMIAGTSVGAVMGAAYAWSQDTVRMTKDALDASWKKMAPLIDPSIPKTGFIKGKKIQDLISSYIGGNIKFSDLKIPLACVATDIDTGEEIVINSGSVPEALRASISIPGIFTVVKREGRYLVDGGLTTPVPVEVVRCMGADFIIAVNVSPDVAVRMGKSNKQRVAARKEPNIFQVIMQSIYITTYSLARNSLENADIVIEPDLSRIGAGDFNKARELITRGRRAAQSAIPEIKRKLENL
ncbi:MAG: patatin-like phospholipase family protein [Dehalococcoidales bacterium]|nr:patatin-like phospholipase family protein [Dehalococcoidales bacterium]